MNYRSFRQASCEHFGCATEEYEQTVFRACLYPHGRFLAQLILRLHPAYFERDFELIRSLAIASDLKTMEAEVNDFATQNCEDGLLRRKLHIRVSGQRALDLGAKVFLGNAVELPSRPQALEASVGMSPLVVNRNAAQV